MQDVSTGGRLVLDGALTVRNAAALCAALRETMAQHPLVSIDCTAAVEIDLSFIQLLIAARASAAAAGKAVSLAARPDGVLLHALTRGGFRVTDHNRAGAGDFWFDGAAE